MQLAHFPLSHGKKCVRGAGTNSPLIWNQVRMDTRDPDTHKYRPAHTHTHTDVQTGKHRQWTLVLFYNATYETQTGGPALKQWINMHTLCKLTGKTEKPNICTSCHTRQCEITTVGNKWSWGHMTLVKGIGTLLWQLSSAHKNLLKGNLTLHTAFMPPPCSSLTNLLTLQSFCPSPSLSKSSVKKSLEGFSLMKNAGEHISPVWTV